MIGVLLEKIEQDRKEIKDDRKEGEKKDAKQDVKDLKKDQQSVRKDQRDVRRDTRDRRHDLRVRDRGDARRRLRARAVRTDSADARIARSERRVSALSRRDGRSVWDLPPLPSTGFDYQLASAKFGSAAGA